MKTSIVLALLAGLECSVGRLLPAREAADELFSDNIPAADAWNLKSKVYANGGSTSEKATVAVSEPSNDTSNSTTTTEVDTTPTSMEQAVANDIKDIIIIEGSNPGTVKISVASASSGSSPTAAPQQGSSSIPAGNGNFGGFGGSLTAAGTPAAIQNAAVATPAAGSSAGNSSQSMPGMQIAQGQGSVQNGQCQCSCSCPAAGFNVAGMIGTMPQSPVPTAAAGSGSVSVSGAAGSQAFAGFGGTLTAAGSPAASGPASTLATSPSTGAGASGTQPTTATPIATSSLSSATSAVTAGAPPPSSSSFPLTSSATVSEPVTTAPVKQPVPESSSSASSVTGSLNSQISFALSLRNAEPTPV